MADFTVKKISASKWIFVGNNTDAQKFEIEITGGTKHPVAGPDVYNAKAFIEHLNNIGFTVDGTTE